MRSARLAILVASLGALVPTPLHAAPAQDSSPAEIVAARELFRQGTEDADAGRFAQGLEKFKRVAAVKETAAVRFNIARCEEALGKTGAALADMELAEREARQDPKGDEVAKLAHDRAEALRPRVPRLLVNAPARPPSGMTVSLDGAKLSVATLGVPLPLDPGAHVLEATAPGREPFRSRVELAAGDSKAIQVTLAPSPVVDPEPTPRPTSGSARRTWGFVSLAVGAAAGGAAVAFLVAHNGAVSDVVAACPNGHCPASQQSFVQGAQSRANTDEPVAIVLASTAAVAAGLGLYLVLSPSPEPAPAAQARVVLSPSAPGAPAGLTLTGSF